MRIKDIKKLYILIAIFIVLIVACFLCFVFNSNRTVLFNPQEKNNNKMEFLNKEKIEVNYKEDLKELVKDYFKMQENEELNAQKISMLQNKMMDMTLNEDQKDFHFNLFLLLENMKEAFNEENQENILLIQSQFREEISECEWLEINS